MDVVKAVGSPRVKLLYDIYHMQIMEGDVIRTIRDNIQYIGHFCTGCSAGEKPNWIILLRRPVPGDRIDVAGDGASAFKNQASYFAHEFVPARDPLVSLKQAFALCTV